MSNNLRQAKKDLKAFAKRAKDVKYTESLLFSYLYNRNDNFFNWFKYIFKCPL